jgi:hypothetical protein
MSTAAPEMSPLEAARVIHDAKSWDAILRQRTEGLTWMMWGFVACAMFLSYEFAAREHAPTWIWPTLWIPWVLAGNVFNVVLWRTAAVARPGLVARGSMGRYALMILVFVAIFTLEFVVFHPDSWVLPMFFAAIAWSGMGLMIPSMSPRGKLTSFCIGLATLLGATALTLAHPTEPTGGVLASLCIGLTAFAGGLAHASLG